MSTTTKRSFMKAFELAAEHRDWRPRADASKLFAKTAEKPTVGELWIYDVIGEDWWSGGGITGKSVAAALAELGDVKTLNIFINSPGGDVFEAKAIYSNLLRFKAEKVVHVDGVAASAATFIAMAGDKIRTASHANWMVHEASAFAYGRSEDMRAMAELLDLQNNDIADIYARQTERPAKEMLELMAAETWMSAAEALNQGFTDEVYEPAPDEDDETEAAAAKASPLVRASLSTDERVRLIRQERRLATLSDRASPVARSGQPQRTNPAAPRNTRP